MQQRFILIPLGLTLFLTACVPSREEADAKLANACRNSITALSNPADQIKFLKTSFSSKNKDKEKIRVVALYAHFIHNHGVMVEKNYTCSYREEWTAFAYRPEFYNLEKDNVRYGNFDGQVVGELSDLMKITEASERAY